MKNISCPIVLALSLLLSQATEAKWTVECWPTRADGVYAIGETVTFRAQALRDGVRPSADEGYGVRIGLSANGKYLASAVTNAAYEAVLSVPFTNTAWVSVSAMPLTTNGQQLVLTPEEEPNKWRRQVVKQCGAVVAPETFRPGAPEPKDFDAYWAAERAKVLASPANAKYVPDPDPETAERQGTYRFSADLPGDTFRGPTAQVKIPLDKSRKYPIQIFVHGTGCFVPPKPGSQQGIPLPFRSLISGPVIYCNLNAHGYELGHPDAYYRDLDQGALKLYQFKGLASDKTWYMKGLVLRLMRTIDELCKRPEWDGKNIIVHGGSQGGAQALLAGGIDPRVNFIEAEVPAMCDFGAHLAGHAAGWPKPYFLKDGVYRRATSFWERDKNFEPDDESCVTRCGYIDALNFAARISPDAHVAITAGGYDGVCPPTGVFAAYWRCPAGDKQMKFAPLGGHCQGDFEEGERQLPAEWKGTVRVDKRGFDPYHDARILHIYAYNTYAGEGRNRSAKYLSVEPDGSRTLTFTGTHVEFVSNGRSWQSPQAELFLDGAADAKGLRGKTYRHQPAGVKTVVVDGCEPGVHKLTIRPTDKWKWVNLGIEEILVSE